ncbi:unnamed protein product [Spirodela intermedia]|uniref:Uncharacterized protein n=1 Tax=Spirodela intermedia TaxID=51605 RepID=A0A7I8JJX9_SPIIN|nr:unnamed protein product [Spirodela intermedia]CAA6670448.1 unnamed protein product [Spirodela intermedia]
MRKEREKKTAKGAHVRPFKSISYL